ncbi:MAG: PilW family protein [Gammaproteobacteria bacterium]|nr:PilW family protein [Gammaproteobacteria bacterium]MBU2158392.1 PilW family protein [Gammaproteobacteria bacterium]MBU2254004.1 PilW family protein [Gammaproteobacteria bacterium]MBU2292804.1 PilW family protein [Gammaproteobacteria bacterium]
MIRPTKHESGFTLIELLVAMVIGLILLLGVSQVFLSSRQTFATNDSMTKLQENGRFALDFIASTARQAGYLSPGSPADRPFPIEPINCSRGSACSSNGATPLGDRVSFSAEPALMIDGNLRDCAGQSVPADKIITNSYFIIPATMGNPQPSLGCSSYSGNNGQPVTVNQRLIDGIESLQVLYGIASNESPLSVGSFISADSVELQNRWADVVAVRIAVLANSIDPVTPTPPQRGYYLLDAAPIIPAADDRRAKQIFTTTIQLKNVY